MADLPIGTVTFLFTDLEGSTRLWEEDAPTMRAAMARHDALLEEAVTRRGGVVFARMGDGIAAAFESATQGVAAAVEAQVALGEEAWGTSAALRSRIGLHAGEGSLVRDQYDSQPLNRCARLMAVAHGGQVLISDSVEILARDGLPPGLGLIDLGEHRLRDLAQPMHVYQVTHPRLAARFPPLRSMDAFMGNLPLQVSSFIGRETEVGRAIDALASARVVTLTGVGGVGKTRLALQVAAEVLPRFRDGAWLVELAPIRDSADVIGAFAALFGVTARTGETVEQALVAFLRAKELLLVVDNCEHLLEPVADLLDVIARSCPQVITLATSREGLALEGEQMLAIPSLRPPRDDVGTEEIARSDAVRLFVERARAADADFALDASNSAAVAQLCRRLDGVPLAIELAAARVTTMSPAELSAALDRRFEVLAGGRRRAVKRHQTLRATIDWSYDLLDERHQRLLARLSVFAGGWTRDAAQAVCADSPIEPGTVFELLTDLVARSLVVADRKGPETRYRLLETIREYAEERLSGHGETMERRDRHGRYFVDWGRTVSDKLLGPEQVTWGNRYLAEQENLFAAMAHAIDTEDVDLAMSLVPTVMPAFHLRYQLRMPVDPVLALSGAREHPGYPLALMTAAWQAVNRGEFTVAAELVGRALDAERADSSPASSVIPLELEANVVLSRVAAANGAWADVVRYSLATADEAQSRGLPGQGAMGLAVAAGALSLAGKFEAAIPIATEGLERSRVAGSPDGIANSRWALSLALSEHDPERARHLLHEVVETLTNLGPETWLAQMVAITAARLRDWDLTAEYARHSIRYFHWMGVRPSLAGMFTLAASAIADTDPEAAAVIQGAARTFSPRAGVASPIDAPRKAAEPRDDFWTTIRRDTNRRLTDALGDSRRRELHAHGAALNGDDAVAFAIAHLDTFIVSRERQVSVTAEELGVSNAHSSANSRSVADTP